MKHLTTDKLLSLGMALHADKRTMEHRVRSIFARRHSAWFASLAAVMFCGMIGVLGFTTACQPVQTEPSLTIVLEEPSKQTDMAILTPSSEESEPKEEYVFPNRWEGTYSVGNAELFIDVPIECPVTGFPVYAVENDWVEPEEIQKIVEHFVPEADASEIDAWNDGDVLGVRTYTDSAGQPVAVNAYGNCWAVSLMLERIPVIQPESIVMQGYAIRNEPKGTQIGDVAISEEQAIDIADSIRDGLGLDMFQFASVEKARLVDMQTEKPFSAGWWVIFCRNDGEYAPFNWKTMQYAIPLGSEQKVVASPYPPEQFQVFVDKQGARFVEQEFPIVVTGVVEQNAKLLPFEEIQDRIIRAFENGFSLIGSEAALTVKRIALIGSVVMMDEKTAQMQIVPTWLVEFCAGDDDYRYCFGIHAIDGTMLNPLNN